MPREQRKRGKKHKKQEQVLEPPPQNFSGPKYEEEYQETFDHGQQTEELSLDAPFGALDPDIKAYFRTVDDQLKEWQEEGINTDVDVEVDANEGEQVCCYYCSD